MNNIKSNWNKQEFKVYLLFYAANADYSINNEEKQLIQSKATHEEYLHIKKVFEADSDFDRIERIKSFREQFYNSDKETEELINNTIELLKIDDNLNCNEMNFIKLFRKILLNK